MSAAEDAAWLRRHAHALPLAILPYPKDGAEQPWDRCRAIANRLEAQGGSRRELKFGTAAALTEMEARIKAAADAGEDVRMSPQEANALLVAAFSKVEG